MSGKDFLKVLQLYRHDLINRLQIIKGYLHINQSDKVKLYMDDLLSSLEQERILMQTNATNFILWILQVNHMEDNIRVSYHFSEEEKLNLATIDDLLTKHCKQLIEQIKISGYDHKMYDVKITFKQKSSDLSVHFMIKGKIMIEQFRDNLFQNLNHHLDIEETPDCLNCYWNYSLC